MHAHAERGYDQALDPKWMVPKRASSRLKPVLQGDRVHPVALALPVGPALAGKPLTCICL